MKTKFVDLLAMMVSMSTVVIAMRVAAAFAVSASDPGSFAIFALGFMVFAIAGFRMAWMAAVKFGALLRMIEAAKGQEESE